MTDEQRGLARAFLNKTQFIQSGTLSTSKSLKLFHHECILQPVIFKGPRIRQRRIRANNGKLIELKGIKTLKASEGSVWSAHSRFETEQNGQMND